MIPRSPRWLVAAPIVLALVACDVRATEPEPQGSPVRTLAFDVDWEEVRVSALVAEGATAHEAREALVRIVAWRLAALGLPGDVRADDAGLGVTLAAEAGARAARGAAASLASLGRCEILVEANEELRATEAARLETWRREHPHRPLDDYNADPARPAPELAWFPPSSSLGGPQEREPLLLELPTTPDRAFGSGDFARTLLTADRLGYPAIGFEIRDGRADEFRAFTRASVGRRLVIVVDGQAVVRAHLVTELGRSGIIEGRFDEARARGLAEDLAPARALLRPR